MATAPGTVTAPSGKAKQFLRAVNPANWRMRNEDSTRPEVLNFQQAAETLKKARMIRSQFLTRDPDTGDTAINYDLLFNSQPDIVKLGIYGLVDSSIIPKDVLLSDIENKFEELKNKGEFFDRINALVNIVYGGNLGLQFVDRFNTAVEEAKKTGTPVNLLELTQTKEGEGVKKESKNLEDERKLDAALDKLGYAILEG